MLLPQPQPQPHPQPHLRRGSSRVAVTGQEQPQPVLDPLFIFSGKVVKSLSNPQHIFIFPHLFITCGFPHTFSICETCILVLAVMDCINGQYVLNNPSDEAEPRHLPLLGENDKFV